MRYAERTLRRSPLFSAVTILVVALGIAASTGMFAVVNAWLLRPLPLERPNELVTVWRTAPASPREPAYFDFYRDYLVWSAENRTVTGLAATFERDYAVTGAGEPSRVHGAIASWNLFDVVGGHAVAGRLFDSGGASAEPSCVISYALWHPAARQPRVRRQPARSCDARGSCGAPFGGRLPGVLRPGSPGGATRSARRAEGVTPTSDRC